MKNKKMVGIIIIIIIMFVGVLLLVNSLINRNSELKDIVETFDTEEELVENLYSKVKIVDYSKDDKTIKNYYYKQDSLKAKDMDKSYKLSLIYNYLNPSKIKLLHISEDNIKYVIAEKDLKQVYKLIFGELDTYEATDFIAGCIPYTYGKEEHIYYWTGYSCANYDTELTETKMIRSEVSDDKVEIYERVAFIKKDSSDKKTVYSDYKYENKILETSNFKIDEVLDDLGEYKYTFIKGEKNYYFESVELIKD